MSDNADELNVAATLRDITASCDKTTGRILRQCEKAARRGKSFVIVKASKEDHECILKHAKDPKCWTPLLEKLASLGFTCWTTNRKTFWLSLTGFNSDYDMIKVSW